MRLLLLFLCSTVASVSLAQPTPSEIYVAHEETISHLRGISVHVSHETDGIAVEASAQIQADIESALRRAGIKVYTQEERRNTDSQPLLWVDVWTQRVRNGRAEMKSYSVELRVTQNATLYGGQEISVDTWETSFAYGPLWERNPLKVAREVLYLMLDRFIEGVGKR